MRQLDGDENYLQGQWVTLNGKVKANEAAERIDWLIANCLRLVASGDWEALYQDPNDGRYWIVFYPESHLHGGGPPSMRAVAEAEAAERFGSFSNT